MKDFGTKVNSTGGDDSGQSSKFGAKAFNSLSSELEKVVESAGLTLDTTNSNDPDTTQMSQAITNYSLSAQAYSDGGTANAYVLSAINTNFVQPTSYIDGEKIRFLAGNANTGASTVNKEGIGVKSIVRNNGDALSAGDIVSGQYYELIYNSATDEFFLNAFDAVDLTSAQTVAGVKTFSDSPLVPTQLVGAKNTKVANTSFVQTALLVISQSTRSTTGTWTTTGLTVNKPVIISISGSEIETVFQFRVISGSASTTPDEGIFRLASNVTVNLRTGLSATIIPDASTLVIEASDFSTGTTAILYQ